ncbi:hypothetical protein SAMN04488580_11551 [Mycobacterium sp. 283mftsu]|nr:hypothetical protein SAMN04488580_11551 [Mycobacterium sp. 283mftsu]
MVALGVLGAISSGVTNGGAVAGSDHAPTNTVFNSPEVPDFNSGATQTWTPGATTAATMSAAPAVKAG